jgi:hypothetical protein
MTSTYYSIMFCKKEVINDISDNAIHGRGSSVSIATGYELDDRAIEVRYLAEARGFFLKPLRPDQPATHRASYLMGTGGK